MKARIYIDGYNFYYAIKESHLRLGWCDFRRLSELMLEPAGHTVGHIKYFTATVDRSLETEPNERDWQSIWLQALNTVEDLEIIPGYYKPVDDKNDKEPHRDGAIKSSEKRSKRT